MVSKVLTMNLKRFLVPKNSQNIQDFSLFSRKKRFFRKTTLNCFKNANCDKCFQIASQMALLLEFSQNVQKMDVFLETKGFHR